MERRVFQKVGFCNWGSTKVFFRPTLCRELRILYLLLKQAKSKVWFTCTKLYSALGVALNRHDHNQLHTLTLAHTKHCLIWKRAWAPTLVEQSSRFLVFCSCGSPITDGEGCVWKGLVRTIGDETWLDELFFWQLCSVECGAWASTLQSWNSTPPHDCERQACQRK